MVKEILIEDFDYNLPEEKIPLHPLEKRDECKLLLRSPEGKLYHRKFKELPDLLPPSSLLVCNNTKVINARLAFHKSTGASIELFLLEPISPSDYVLNFQSRDKCVWKCLVGNSKKWKEGPLEMEVTPEDKKSSIILTAERKEVLADGASAIEFSWNDSDLTFAQILESAGKIPIPPYLNRESEEKDLQDYQTVYAKVKGSVAAPTAGLHFTPELFKILETRGTEVEKLTLHVGAGTFKPVKSDKIGDHPMHSEPFTITKIMVKKLIEWKAEDRPIVAVGTTSVRTLESLTYIGQKLERKDDNALHVNQWDPYENDATFDTLHALRYLLEWMNANNLDSITASTNIMIAPGFEWRIVDGLITNFHQPKSTLLLLVSSFLEGGDWKGMYEAALENNYRFLSYGDACLLIRN